MSAPTPPPEHTSRPERVVGIFVTVVWAAFVFAAYGLIAVLLDRDPIELPVGPYYGIVALALAGLVVYVGIQLAVPARSPWLGAVATMGGVYLAIVGSAAVVDLGLAASQALSPFVLAATVLAGLTTVGTWAAMGWRARR